MIGTMICLMQFQILLKRVREFHYTIKGYDKAPSAVQKAKDNIKMLINFEYILSKNKTFDTKNFRRKVTCRFQSAV
jgi:hypothetical protein